MKARDARREVRRILAAPLDQLVDAGLKPPADTSERWDLRETDKVSLRAYGLPPARTDELMGMCGAFQVAADPELAEDGVPMYRIGTFGQAKIAAAEGSGVVYAVPTHREVHPQLRALNPDGISTVVVNSSVTQAVELAWRWHWLLPLLADQQSEAGKGEAEAGETLRTTGVLPDIYAGVRALCLEVLEAFRRVDPTAVAGDESFWAETVMEDVP